ncbi:Glycosyltransferase [Rhynchospora pubera]|uniref:Glycosyltransferase n=1 Tax=Rhynchospora pubera TaxID=906938 RepID=A0AAV8HFI4_9POAL|nr:Glycosyltransferase [Rhynchospora pubera]KAJ4816635.1 Glycosyltransferase [Rhynchospora pubera]
MDPSRPHVALLPSSGMGHLIPVTRLAASLSDLCNITVISILPTVSTAESHHFTDFFNSYPKIHPVNFQLPPLDSSAHRNVDPFFLRWARIRESASDIFSHLLKSAPSPISAIVTDIAAASAILPSSRSNGIPCYVLFTSSAAMLSFFKYFPTYQGSNPVSIGNVEIPGLRTVPVASLPRPLHDPSHSFTQSLIGNSLSMVKSDGIIVNTFESFEPDSLAWLRGEQSPPVIAVGPLPPVKMAISTVSTVFTWLDEQPERSVVYISFGSRTAMSKEQIKELGLGLEASGCRFLWVIKTSMVDTEDRTELNQLLGEGFLERVKERGLVTKGWVEQDEVLRHKAVGGFLSHCGWNSVTEAAIYGVRVLAWPRLGDQRINADVVARSGLGLWPEEWSWEGEESLVMAAEISNTVKEMMADEKLLKSAQKVGEAAQSAARPDNGLAELVRKLKGFN